MTMTDQELEALLAKGESDRLEYKASLANPGELRKAICAFANDLPDHRKPGVVIIGLNDDGGCAHFPVTDEHLRTLTGMRSDGKILPFPAMFVQKRVLRGCEVAVVVVPPAEAPPIRYDGTVWIRIGPRRDRATPDEERRLSEKRRARDLPFDLRPMPSASLDHLDLEAFRHTYLPSALSLEVLEANERPRPQQLASVRFTTPDGIPTVLGLLTIGKQPRDFVSGAYIQFLRIGGTELTDPVSDQAEIDGPLHQLLWRLDDKLHAHIATTAVFTATPTEVQSPDYPLVALQQLARNAILHRNYETSNAPVRITWFDDRVEIHSPGGPFGQVNQANFGTPGLTDYRNPHLAEVLKNLGYVQRFGVGIATARRALEQNGNPPPGFEVNPAFINVTLKKRL
jgi:ATP-dependent DNA helicase RecG